MSSLVESASESLPGMTTGVPAELVSRMTGRNGEKEWRWTEGRGPRASTGGRKAESAVRT